MALAKAPGPEGLGLGMDPIDTGTLSRSLSPQPGPIGLYFAPPVFMAPNSLARTKGITVHPESKITAQEWVKKIKASEDVPDYFKKQISARGNVLFVTSTTNFRVPSDVIPKVWLEDWLSAFNADEWEITSGILEMRVEKPASGGPLISIVHNPELSKGESVAGFTKFTMTVKGNDTKDIAIERGNTLPEGIKLNSGHKVIVIARRINLNLGGKIQSFDFEDAELLETWFHEIAAHAGRNSVNKKDFHGDISVDGVARDIGEMFPKTKTVPRVFKEVERFLGAKSN